VYIDTNIKRGAMGYRPITDFWFLTRAKLKDGRKYYGAYLGGFPERARVLVGTPLSESLLHVCGGMAKYYPYKRGFGLLDKTLDLDPATNPDFCWNALDPLPLNDGKLWDGILIDPPYSEEDSEHYVPGKANYPSPGKLVANALLSVKPGGRVGIIHYAIPRMPKNAVFVACVGVACGFQNRIRVYSVFERVV
jgi:hypothetical protein